MKKLIYISCFILLTILQGCYTNINKNNNGPESTFNTLDNYGRWINVPGLGQVWRPSDETNWQPYYNGQWMYTDSGWMWVGNEPYAWMVYHYGYWTYDNFYGWVWIPNYDWQPARVRWYHSNGYVGWAPLPPPGIKDRNNYDQEYIRKTWVVVPEKNFINRDVGRFKTRNVEPGADVVRNNNGGRAPDVGNIERASGTRIEQVRPERQPVNEGGRSLIRIRLPEQARQNEINRNNQTENPILVPRPPTTTTPRPEPAKPAQQPKPPLSPRPEVNKNNPGRPSEPPSRPEKVRKPENSGNENAVRNEGRKNGNGKRPEVTKNNENRNVKKRDEKIIKKNEKKSTVKENKKNKEKIQKKDNNKNSRNTKTRDSGNGR